MSAKASKLVAQVSHPHAYGVEVSIPRHLTIYQAEALVVDLKLAIKQARSLNEAERASGEQRNG